MSRLVRVSLICLVSLLVACADDLDFPDNRRSLDITNDNAEEHLWSAYQVLFSSLYFSDLDDTLDNTDFGGVTGTGSCSVSGEYAVNFSRETNEDYEESDQFSVTYSDCVKANAVKYNGTVRGEYIEIEGYNPAFSDQVEVADCKAQVETIKNDEDDLDDPVTIDDQAESVAFDKQGDRIFVRYFNSSGGASGSQVTKAEYELSSEQDAVVINRSATDPSSTLASDGAALYKLKDGEHEQINCLYYKRRVELELESFVLVNDSVEHSLGGTLEIIEELTEPGRINYRLLGDDVSVKLRYGNAEEQYYLNELEWRQETEFLTNNTYAISFDAELVNRIDGNISESRSFSGSPLRGVLGAPNASDGILSVFGVNLENAAFNINSASSITFAIEAEGDRNGNGSSDPTADNFDSSWSDFLGRVFVRPPEIAVEGSGPDPGSNSVTNI